MEVVLEREPTQTCNNEEPQSLSSLGNTILETEVELSTQESLVYREMISPSLWQRLTDRIEKEEGADSESSQKIMNESLGFLVACAENSGVALSPSEKVDVGWHTFILYTKDYAEFCENIAGEFIHHEPSDSKEAEQTTEAMTIKDTFDFLQEKGYEVDPELWLTDLPIDETQRCSSHCRNTCSHG